MTKQSRAMKVLLLFKKQLEKAIDAKVVIAPTPIEEKGVIIKLSLFKTLEKSRLSKNGSEIKLRLAVEGFAESMTGLDQSLRVIEKIEELFSHSLRLSLPDGLPLANTRIIQRRSEDDSFLDNPDSTAVQEVLDERLVLIYLNEQAEEVLDDL